MQVLPDPSELNARVVELLGTSVSTGSFRAVTSIPAPTFQGWPWFLRGLGMVARLTVSRSRGGTVLAYSQEIYDWIKTFHVLGAIVWVGGGVFVQIYATRLIRANETARVMAFAKDIERIGLSVFLPASILVLLLGIALVWYSPAWDLTQLWVILGLLGIANTIVVGAVFLGPESGRIGRLAEERGASDPEVQRRVRRIFAISRYDLAVLLLVVVDMVVKPGA